MPFWLLLPIALLLGKVSCLAKTQLHFLQRQKPLKQEKKSRWLEVYRRNHTSALVRACQICWTMDTNDPELKLEHNNRIWAVTIWPRQTVKVQVHTWKQEDQKAGDRCAPPSSSACVSIWGEPTAHLCNFSTPQMFMTWAVKTVLFSGLSDDAHTESCWKWWIFLKVTNFATITLRIFLF